MLLLSHNERPACSPCCGHFTSKEGLCCQRRPDHVLVGPAGFAGFFKPLLSAILHTTFIRRLQDAPAEITGGFGPCAMGGPGSFRSCAQFSWVNVKKTANDLQSTYTDRRLLVYGLCLFVVFSRSLVISCCLPLPCPSDPSSGLAACSALSSSVLSVPRPVPRGQKGHQQHPSA